MKESGFGQKCCIVGCNKTFFHRSSGDTHFHNLGRLRKRNFDRYLEWVKAANTGLLLHDHEVICSNHFSDEDYVASDLMKRRLMPPGTYKKGPRLNDDAVPHCNLPTQQENGLNHPTNSQVSADPPQGSQQMVSSSSREFTVGSVQPAMFVNIKDIKTEPENVQPVQNENTTHPTWTDFEGVQVKIEPFEEVFISSFDFEGTSIKLEPTEQPNCFNDVQSPPESRPVFPKLICDICNFYTGNKSQLATHIWTHFQYRSTYRRKKPKPIPVHCDDCGVEYTQIEMLNWHQEFCHGPNPIVKLVKVNETQQYECVFCEFPYRGLIALIMHLRLHHKLVNLPFPCSVCDKQFYYRGGLENHKCKNVNKHPTYSSGQGIQCKMCNDYFDSDDKVKGHLSNFHAISDPRYPCGYCDKKFNCFSHLKFHCDIKHPGKKYLQCDICNVGFISTKGFEKHNIFKHWSSVFTYNE